MSLPRAAIAALPILLLAPMGGRGLAEAAPDAAAEPAPEAEPEPKPERRDIAIRVIAVAPDGSASPLAGQQVTVERYSRAPGRDTVPELDKLWRADTDERGVVRFESIDELPGHQVIPTVLYKGISYKGAPLAAANVRRPVELRVYEPASGEDAFDDLRMTIFGNLTFNETNLICHVSVAVLNEGNRVVDAESHPTGLPIPILFPAVFGGALTPGVLPPETAGGHMATDVSPELGRLAFERGGIVYRGPVIPDQELRIQVRFPIKLTTERLDLALSPPVDADNITIDTRWSRRIAPRVYPGGRFSAVSREEGEEIHRRYELEEPVVAGADFLVHLDRLPRPAGLETMVATAGSVALGLLFLLFLLAGRRRE